MRLSYSADSLILDPFETCFFFFLRDKQSSLWGWFSALLGQEPFSYSAASWIMWFLTLGGGNKNWSAALELQVLFFLLLSGVFLSILGWFPHTHMLIIYYSAEDLKRTMYEYVFFHCAALSFLVYSALRSLAALASQFCLLSSGRPLYLVLVLSPCTVAWALFPDSSWDSFFVIPSRDLWNPLDDICENHCFVQFLFQLEE